MPVNPAKFGWYELMTTDTKAAEIFYRSVIGWDAKDSGMPGQSYTILSMGPTMVGGLMAIPEAARAMGLSVCRTTTRQGFWRWRALWRRAAVRRQTIARGNDRRAA